MYSKSVKIFPSECRQRVATYRAKLSITVRWSVDGQVAGSVSRIAGQVPIMVKVGSAFKYQLLEVFNIYYSMTTLSYYLAVLSESNLFNK